MCEAPVSVLLTQRTSIDLLSCTSLQTSLLLKQSPCDFLAISVETILAISLRFLLKQSLRFPCDFCWNNPCDFLAISVETISLRFSNHLDRRNGFFQFYSSSFPCLVCPPSLTTHFPYIFYTSLSTWFSVFLFVSCWYTSNILLSTCPSTLLLCQYHLTFSLRSSVSLVLRWLILSHVCFWFFLRDSTHIHRIILISFTSGPYFVFSLLTMSLPAHVWCTSLSSRTRQYYLQIWHDEFVQVIVHHTFPRKCLVHYSKLRRRYTL